MKIKLHIKVIVRKTGDSELRVLYQEGCHIKALSKQVYTACISLTYNTIIANSVLEDEVGNDKEGILPLSKFFRKLRYCQSHYFYLH